MAYKTNSPKDRNRSRTISFKKESKMKRYPISFDEEINSNVTGFMNFIEYTPNLEKGDMVWKIEAGYEHRIDLISTKFYGTSKFDWIIEQVNNVRDPIKDLKIETSLVIPSRSTIYNLI